MDKKIEPDGLEQNIVELNDVSFAYEKDNYVLESIDLKIKEGEYVGIIGDNGSAKSTLLKLMLGLLKPNKGHASLFDEDVSNFRDWGKVGYLSQQVRGFNQTFPATVEEVIGANLYSQKGILKFLNKSDRVKIDEVLETVNMKGYEKRLIGSLSGGQQQKVFIARLLIGVPEIIFMDEPMVGVDYSSQSAIYEILDHINKFHNIAIVMVTHDVKEIFNRAGKILCMNNKKVNVYDEIECKSKEEKLEILTKNLKTII